MAADRRRWAFVVMAALLFASTGAVLWIAVHNHDTLVKTRTPTTTTSGKPTHRSPRTVVVRPTPTGGDVRVPPVTVIVTPPPPGSGRPARPAPTTSRSPRPTPSPSPSVCVVGPVCLPPLPLVTPTVLKDLN